MNFTPYISMDACAGNVTDVCKIGQELSVRNFSRWVDAVKQFQVSRGGSRILGKGGSDKYIHNWGRVREGACPCRNSKWVWGSADSSPSGVWGEAPAAFLLLRLFSMKFTVTYTSRDIRITRACMDSDEKTVHSLQCYGSYCSAIKFMTQSFCEFVTEACTWPSKHSLHVGL